MVNLKIPPPLSIEGMYSILEEIGELYRLSPADESIVEFLLVNWGNRSFGDKVDYGQLAITREKRIGNIRDTVNSRIFRKFREDTRITKFNSFAHQEIMYILMGHAFRRKLVLKGIIDESVNAREKQIADIKRILSSPYSKAIRFPESVLASINNIPPPEHLKFLKEIISIKVPDYPDKMFEFVKSISPDAPEELLFDSEKFSGRLLE